MKSIFITLLAITLLSFKLNDNRDMSKAEEYMNYLSEHKIRGGCFYIKNDSVYTFKNYRQ